MFALGVFLQEAGWEALVFGHFSQPLSPDCLSLFLYSPMFLILCPRVGSTFPKLIFVPSVHTQSGWEWLWKFKGMALSCVECFIAVLAAFYLCCSRTVITFPFRGIYDMPSMSSSSAISSDRSWLLWCVLGPVSPQRRPWALTWNELGSQTRWPHNYKIICVFNIIHFQI